MSRTALLVTHTGRRDSTAHARTVAGDLIAAGFEVRVVAEEVADLDLPGVVPVSGVTAAEGAEIVFALGGDGTFLRAAELARPAKAPLLGINLGRVGFLAEAEIDDLDKAVRDAVARNYTVDERLTLDVSVEYEGGSPSSRGRSTRSASRRASGRRCSSCSSTSTAGRCRATAATAWSARPRPAPPRTPSPPAGRWSGPRWRRCCWCRSARTPCSAGRW